MVAQKVDPERLVFVDEMGTNTSLAPLYAYSPKGTRSYAQVPRNRGPNTTLLRSEEHTSELQSRQYLVCRLLLEKKINKTINLVNLHTMLRSVEFAETVLVEICAQRSEKHTSVLQPLHSVHFLRLLQYLIPALVI